MTLMAGLSRVVRYLLFQASLAAAVLICLAARPRNRHESGSPRILQMIPSMVYHGLWNWNRRWLAGWATWTTNAGRKPCFISTCLSSVVSCWGSLTPVSCQLSGKLRELRFYCGDQRTRITYWVAPGRRIIALTVFTKTRMRETGEIRRAIAAMARCQREGHELDDESGDGSYE